ncbi:hypothetical protein H9Q08_05125 [Chryseobacterium sp. PS-8]|uniref:Uncharacterized protein n=1 Tax=Chryseobacterium indicum TaxID=2766954 RepID=A0ABS9C2B8_9FLAO|nr:hypothetical protein [Chryseobacterium sp. PS-8]MCF2218680.1 hypothetical protein [Chryseobacterium sp. PS-8]
MGYYFDCLVQLNYDSPIIVGTNIAPAVRPAVENKPVPTAAQERALDYYHTLIDKKIINKLSIIKTHRII